MFLITWHRALELLKEVCPLEELWGISAGSFFVLTQDHMSQIGVLFLDLVH